MNLKIFNKTNKVVAGPTPEPPDPRKLTLSDSPLTPIDTVFGDEIDTNMTLASPSRRERVKTMGQKKVDAGKLLTQYERAVFTAGQLVTNTR